ncbi:MAG TPA: gamma carbonic anhydrase family protein [Candidatus Eisenbacteria bacterium]|nr:gamma carbonic anhydrase family protein [Candidatus Eisenbacteria bacterium]
MPEFELDGTRPRVHPTAFVAPTAVLIGDVEVGPHASVWFGAVLRGDEAAIVVGPGSNVQDNSVIHCSHDLPTVLGENVTVGHHATLEGCVVEAGAVVGMGCIMLQRSRLGAGSMLAAGSVLGEGREVPPGHLAAGAPAEVKKPLSGSSASWVTGNAEKYQQNAHRFRKGLRSPD